MSNWLLIVAGLILVALGLAFLVPVWLAWPAGLALIAVGMAQWSKGRRQATGS
jgi:type III secretory pathway component EscR